MWSKQLLEGTFAAAMDAMAGCLSQEANFTLDQGTIDTKNRRVNGIANVESISRSGWLIRLDGLDLKQYRKNPVVLASHMAFSFSTMMPGAIGTVGQVSKSEKAIAFKNMAFDEDPLAEAWWQKIVNRTVRMVSIGFLPLEWQYVEESPKKKGDAPLRYIEIPRSELLEISPVAVGANRGAFIDTGRELATILAKEEAADHSTGRLAARIEQLEQAIEAIKEQATKSNTSTTPTTPTTLTHHTVPSTPPTTPTTKLDQLLNAIEGLRAA